MFKLKTIAKAPQTPQTQSLPCQSEFQQQPVQITNSRSRESVQPEEQQQTQTLPCQFSPLSEIRPSFLSDLFDDGLLESDTTANIQKQLLHNQQVLFSLMAKVLGEVQSLRSSVQLVVAREVNKGVDFSGSSLPNRGSEQERELEPFDSSCEGSPFVLPEEDASLSPGVDGEEDGSFFQEIVKLKRASCSIGNFAVKLVQKFYSLGELVNRNCAGSRGKDALDPIKLAKVKQYTFNMYPTPSTLKEMQWKKCVIAIDEYLRRKRKEVSDRQE